MNSIADNVTILKGENLSKTVYSPQIKILKRNRNNDIKRDLQKPNTEAELKKTLKLREAEYQAARNRILGENYDETKPKLVCEEVKESKISIIKRPPCASPTCLPASLPYVASPVRPLTILGDKNLVEDSNLWQPRGPDNNYTGFCVQR